MGLRSSELNLRGSLYPRRCTRCSVPKAWQNFARTGGSQTRRLSVCRECIAKYNKQRNTPEANRESWLRRYYGITVDQYEQLLIKQNDKCGICPKLASEEAGSFCVDHDHRCCPGRRTCGYCIRGLLCHQCNLQLALADEYFEEVRVWLGR